LHNKACTTKLRLRNLDCTSSRNSAQQSKSNQIKQTEAPKHVTEVRNIVSRSYWPGVRNIVSRLFL